jgi:hypothetical protein
MSFTYGRFHNQKINHNHRTLRKKKNSPHSSPCRPETSKRNILIPGTEFTNMNKSIHSSSPQMGTKAATEVRMTSTTSSSVMPKDSRSFAPKRKGHYGNGGAPGESYNVDNWVALPCITL